MISTLSARSYPCATIFNDEKKIHRPRYFGRSIMHDGEPHEFAALDGWPVESEPSSQVRSEGCVACACFDVNITFLRRAAGKG